MEKIKKFLQVLLLKVCEFFHSGESKETVVYFGLYESSLHFCLTFYQASTVYKKGI